MDVEYCYSMSDCMLLFFAAAMKLTEYILTHNRKLHIRKKQLAVIYVFHKTKINLHMQIVRGMQTVQKRFSCRE